MPVSECARDSVNETMFTRLSARAASTQLSLFFRCWYNGKLNEPHAYKITALNGAKIDLCSFIATVPERLRGLTRNQMGSARAGSSPAGCVLPFRTIFSPCPSAPLVSYLLRVATIFAPPPPPAVAGWWTYMGERSTAAPQQHSRGPDWTHT